MLLGALFLNFWMQSTGPSCVLDSPILLDPLAWRAICILYDVTHIFLIEIKSKVLFKLVLRQIRLSRQVWIGDDSITS